jgi:hypothetical protein
VVGARNFNVAPAVYFVGWTTIMKILRFLGKVGCCLALCASLAGADSIQLRNGRHLQGKYIGGTTTAVGFMTGGAVEYFATSEILVLMFDNGNDSPLSELKPNPMKGHARPTPAGVRHLRRISSSAQNRVSAKNVSSEKQKTASISNSRVQSNAKLEVVAERQLN